jgi:hypothetical protein
MPLCDNASAVCTPMDNVALRHPEAGVDTTGWWTVRHLVGHRQELGATYDAP